MSIYAQQNREVTTPRKPSIKRDEALIKQFNEYYNKRWVENDFYLPSDFIKEFKINRHLARYYLMNMVYEKKLFRVKYYNKTYYRKLDTFWHPRFKELMWFGVEVTRWTMPRKEEVVEESKVIQETNDRMAWEFDADYVDSDYLGDEGEEGL